MQESIRIAFFDIDGTLLPFRAGALPDSTQKALAALRRRGVKVFIASGRPPIHLPLLHALDGIPFDGYVTMNGQYCYLADGTQLYSHAIDPAALRTLLPYIQREKISVGFIEKDRSTFNLINERSAEFCQRMQQYTGDVAACIEAAPIYQLSAFLPADKQQDFLASCPGCVAVRWNDDFADVLPAGGGKTEGLAHVLKALGLTREQAIAFGDGGNDVEMLRYAGIGVAMGNACPEAKAAADYITDDVTADGLANGLRHFGLI
ncbi:MAG TPA: Cof-type HAD-IIB family hydrolase [Candidatus Gemmiger excrementigallinarum]|uniref:Cof-type HAD-IIB family hydrolase n=1 Tax=Candidatus Gemmiger excrementigallinarum TaxID=2838609 RepID=A0A9D2ET74_9FIRM|nr:Cof-type HAD-IIB family hydrolase [Candidatus Gemmiger excrementigallinarum]